MIIIIILKKKLLRKCSFILINTDVFFFFLFFFLISIEQIDLVFLSRLSSASGKSIRFVFLFVFVIVVDVLAKKTWPEVFSFSFFLFFPVKWYGANLALFFLRVNFYIDYIVNNKIYEK